MKNDEKEKKVGENLLALRAFYFYNRPNCVKSHSRLSDCIFA
jgi:hypothetical protein